MKKNDVECIFLIFRGCGCLLLGLEAPSPAALMRYGSLAGRDGNGLRCWVLRIGWAVALVNMLARSVGFVFDDI